MKITSMITASPKLNPSIPFATTTTTCRSRAKQKTKNSSSRDGGVKRGFGVRTTAADKENWQCVTGCGACCKLDKGPAFPSPEEIFDQPSDLQLYRSMIGADGWCTHYNKATRTCSIYEKRPTFCRVQPEVFYQLYGIQERRFIKEACRDTIKAIYGSTSYELKSFNRVVRSGGTSDI